MRIWPLPHSRPLQNPGTFFDHREPQPLAQVASLMSWCWWTFLCSCTPFVFLLVGLGASICASHRDMSLIVFVFVILLKAVKKQMSVPGVVRMALLIFCKTLLKVCGEHCASAVFWEEYEPVVLRWKSTSAGNILEVNRGQLPEMGTQGRLSCKYCL